MRPRAGPGCAVPKDNSAFPRSHGARPRAAHARPHDPAHRSARGPAQGSAGGPAHGPVVSLPRALSKLGFCSRTEARALIDGGRVRIDGRPALSPTMRVDLGRTRITVDGAAIRAEEKFYLMLNKPRGLVTTRRDPQQRGTVYDCLPDDAPFLSPVGRLDKASEGLLLLTNDTGWADHLTNPASGVPKTYHVKIDRMADDAFLAALSAPVEDGGERLSAASVRLLRTGTRSCWIEVVLTEGRNRQVRRMVSARGANVVRLVRTAIGGLPLGDLAKGQVRSLTRDERDACGLVTGLEARDRKDGAAGHPIP
ncbi:MAG: pseudouridine synthase [Sphingobium sp.]